MGNMKPFKEGDNPMTPSIAPALVVHADWGSNPKKRWMARAVRQATGHYRAYAPEPVGEAKTLIERLHTAAGPAGLVLLGFDFPIGLPLAYAKQAGIDDFLTVLPQLGQGEWADFYRVAERPEAINLYRPFYPHRPGGTRQQHLLFGLKVASINALRRRCDLPRPNRRAAAPLFWTLGGQQVGKAAILGWQTMLGPTLRSGDIPLAIWPFSGPLFELFRPGQVVVAETYPAECYRHLGVAFPRPKAGRRSGKRVQQDRQANAASLLEWADAARIEVMPELQGAIESGFGPSKDGEDPFDAVVGLFGMLNVVLGRRTPGAPDDEDVRKIEGWILGQEFVN